MYTAYGATKAAFPQLAATLQAELADTPLGFHVLSPGMMLTDLLLEGATAANKQVFNILCEHPETAAAFLVPRARTAVARGTTGTYTRYLTPLAAVGRLLSAPRLMGRFFDGQGNAVYLPEHERILGRAAKATARQQAKARAQGSNLQLAYSLSLVLSVVVMMADAKVLH
jgi:chlorophyll(ide) b reductase